MPVSWLAPGLVATVVKSSPRPGPRRIENVAGEGVRCDPCGQKPPRRCAMRVRPVQGYHAALGLSARRRRADLQRTDRPGSSVGSWTTSPAGIRMYTNERTSMYTNERTSDVEERWSRCSWRISRGVTTSTNPWEPLRDSAHESHHWTRPGATSAPGPDRTGRAACQRAAQRSGRRMPLRRFREL